MIVNCPICQQPVEWITDNTHRPFCSARCKLIDLGAWANDEYTIAEKHNTQCDTENSQDPAVNPNSDR